MDLTKEALEKLLQLGIAQAGPFVLNEGEPVMLVPTGYAAQSMAEFCPPRRIQRQVCLLEAGSFCDYVNRFKDADTLIFAKVTDSGAILTAYLDYHRAPVHSPEEPSRAPEARYVSHMANLPLSETQEWKVWTAANRKHFTQVEFATWLEDNAALFNCVKDGALKGAELLELVSTLHGKSDVRFNTMLRLKDGGNRLMYDEDVGLNGVVKGDAIELPAVISAGMSVFQGGEPFQVDARLKTRIEGRKLTLWFETIALHKLVRDSVLSTVRLVAEKTGIVPLIGNA